MPPAIFGDGGRSGPRICPNRIEAEPLALHCVQREDGADMDENALIEYAQAGDLDAFNRLVLEYQSRAYNLAYRMMNDPDAAADATQEAFIAAYRNIKRFRGGSFRAWLLRIVTNACYDEFRRRKRRPATSLEDLSPEGEDPGALEMEPLGTREDGPEHSLERSELVQAIERCLENLPAEFRAVAILTDVEGYPYEDVSAMVGSPVGTVKSRLARARARMRDCLRTYRELLPLVYRLNGEAVI